MMPDANDDHRVNLAKIEADLRHLNNNYEQMKAGLERRLDKIDTNLSDGVVTNAFFLEYAKRMDAAITNVQGDVETNRRVIYWIIGTFVTFSGGLIAWLLQGGHR